MSYSLSPTEKPTRRPSNKTPTSAFIETHKLSIAYGNKTILDAVSLDMQEKQITAIVGPSGCGKSSFLTALNRLSDLNTDCQVSGQVIVNGEDIYKTDSNLIQLRRTVGMIFQRPSPFPFSISKNIEWPLKEHGIKSRSERSAITESVLKDIGLWKEVKDRLQENALSLSGGQQQRLCIARALALQPQALLMDEPCSALDPIASGVVEDLILRLKARYTIVIVTHNLAQARRISDQSAFFWVDTESGVGKLIEHGPTEPLFEQPKNRLTAAYVNGMRG